MTKIWVAIRLAEDVARMGGTYFRLSPSIKVIHENTDVTNNLSFELINPECISEIINNFDTSKPTQ